MVKIKEVLPNPTVQEVAFQINFNNLLYIKNIAGDFQYDIMKLFEESSEFYRRKLVFFQKDGEVNSSDINNIPQEEYGKKVWRFSNKEKRIQVNLTTDSLNIVSKHHKTYKREGSHDKFRDIIQFVVDKFLEHVRIQKFNKIGLRYIDHCPLPEGELTNESFSQWYNTRFSLDTIDISKSKEIGLINIYKVGKCFIKYIENYDLENEPRYVLDFDGYIKNIEVEKYLESTDEIYQNIFETFCDIIKEPVLEIMKEEKK